MTFEDQLAERWTLTESGGPPGEEARNFFGHSLYPLIPKSAEAISYSQIKALLRSGQLGEVVIYDKEITGKVRSARRS
jgi:hypothetical protein